MKKAQSGMNAAILIAVILGLIVLYTIFLPTSEREKLFYNKSSSERSSETAGNILLKEFPNSVDKIEKIDKKTIPNIYLYKSKEAKELEKINPLSVRNGVFDKKTKTTEFSIEDLENTDNVLLTFSAPKNKGTLSITLNGEIIYEKDIESPTVEPIKFKKSALKENNELKFEVSSVGFKFWSTNEYILEDIKIIGDVMDTTRQVSRNIFSFSEREYNNLEEAKLKFVPYCGLVSEVGTLQISINNQNIFTAVPVCDDHYKQVIPLNILKENENYIEFKTAKGSYSIEQIELEFEVKDTQGTLYYFEINDSNWEKIDKKKKDVNLEIDFVDDNENKRAILSINGHLTNIDQEKPEYKRNIRAWMEEGNNYIEIRPKTDLEIKELKIEIEK